MKKALFTVCIIGIGLAIAVAVLAYKLSTRPYIFVGKSGATHQRHDHNGKTVNTQECETLLGKNGDVCVIPISYLESMTPDKDIAMEIHHKETIVWYGDKGETIAVQQMAGVDCSNHSQADNPPYGSDPLLVDITAVTPNLTYAHITDNPSNDRYCYKTNINVTVNGRTTTIDPHTFDQPDTP